MAEEVSMRERLKRAIERADCHSVGFLDRAVDAVLDELGEPTPGMLEAASVEAQKPAGWHMVYRNIFRAMIDAAKS